MERRGTTSLVVVPSTRGYTSSVHHGGSLPFVRPVASIMQRRPPPQEGKRLAPAGCARGGSYNGKAASPLHTGNTHTHTTAVEKSRQARKGRRGARGGDGRRKRKRKKAKRGRPQRECTGNRIGVVRNIIVYTVRVSWNPARRCRCAGVRGLEREGWKSWWKKYGGGEWDRQGKEESKSEGSEGEWMEACRLIVVCLETGPDLCMRFYDGR